MATIVQRRPYPRSVLSMLDWPAATPPPAPAAAPAKKKAPPAPKRSPAKRRAVVKKATKKGAKRK